MSRTPSLALLVAGLAFFAGCSASAPVASQPAASEPAASQPAASQPAPAQSSTTSAAEPAGPAGSADDFIAKVTAGMKGVTSYHVVMSMTSGSTEIKVESDVDAKDPSKPNQHMFMDMGGMKIEMISIDGDSYMKGLLGDGWFKVSKDLAEKSSSGVDTDQSQWLTANKDAFKKVEEVGKDQVGGVSATHYRLTMDGAQLKDLGSGTSLGSGDLVYDCWVDDQGRMIKSSFDLSQGSTPMKMEATMSKFNEPVSVVAPKKFTEMG